ncbi:putative sulfate/molybdate transporter [Calditrichota bacterium GD2]
MKKWLRKIDFLRKEDEKPENQFTLSEFSGSVGDLGTLLPLAFALIVFNGFSSAIIFFLFGVIYLLTGWFYRVPVSVQPLKAMSVIAIGQGFSPEFLAGTSVLYGLLMVFLALTGLIRWLQNWFTPALVRGIQFGIGLILTQKALELVWQKGILLHLDNSSLSLGFLLLALFLAIIWWFQVKKDLPAALIMIFLSILFIAIWGPAPPIREGQHLSLKLHLPDFSIWKEALIFLIIPQLPLTLGNAVYAANDSCHTLWGKQAQRVTPTRLAFSIGLSDVLIGLFKGFPVCHGAGGMGAHAQFGARTGGATMIIGAVLVISALVPALNQFIFLIPVPLLAAMLIFDSYRMMIMVRRLEGWQPLFVALLVGGISFLTRNLTIALVAGFLTERFLKLMINKSTKTVIGAEND